MIYIQVKVTIVPDNNIHVQLYTCANTCANTCTNTCANTYANTCANTCTNRCANTCINTCAASINNVLILCDLNY